MKNDNHVWDNKLPTAQMLGRWQPWHAGHQKLFEEILKKTGHSSPTPPKQIYNVTAQAILFALNPDTIHHMDTTGPGSQPAEIQQTFQQITAACKLR